jgi:ubiquinone/menaquinone biosynthesis C-methylase UbiE
MDKSFINPDEILDQIQLKADMVAAEFGCGSGGFLIPLAKRLEDGLTISDLAVDLVFIPNVLFQVEDKDAIITEAERILKKQGKLIIIDWLPQAAQGPAQDERVAPKDIKKMAQELGFKLEKEFKAGKYHYVLVFKKA